ncbi:MAG: NAD(P)/FAD-dependent oxidoreductase [Ornithinimicrobium sp.]
MSDVSTRTPDPLGSAESDASVDDAEVIVVGAGLAGLMCATVLQRSGVEVQVLEAADEVGGRIRTDVVDGFVMDRGFQVLNPAYPAVQQHIDVEALGLQMFGSGAGVRRQDRLAVLADPLREPEHLLDVLRSGLLQPAELLALARWALPALGPVSRLTSGPDSRRADSMARAGLHGPLRRVVDAFVAGVVLEDDGSTSNGFTQLLLRMFALGSPGLPQRGMRALPEQLADRLHRSVRTGHSVDAVRDETAGGVVQVDGRTLRADLVVVATGAPAAASLLGIPAPRMKGVVTDWFTMDEAPSGLDMLIVDGRERPGPIKNTAVVTAAAPSYAPPGRHLVQTSVLMSEGADPVDVREVRAHAAELYGVPTDTWELVHRHEVPHALPAQDAPLQIRTPMQVSAHVIACGDHMDTASIQGAMVSGRRAAQGYLRRRTQRP